MKLHSDNASQPRWYGDGKTESGALEKGRRRLPRIFAIFIGLGFLATVSTRAGTATFDFNTDPGGVWYGAGDAKWLATRGVANTGCIGLSDNTNQTGALLLADFDNGLVVKAFTLECMITVGDWYGSPPGYGFSVNYARATDPIIGLIESGIDPGRGGRTDGWAGSQDNGGNEDNLPEEGTQTGVAIGFDTWGNGNPPVGGADGSNDLRGISVRVDGKLLTQVPMPDILFSDGDNHDYANDASSLITGPFSNGGDPNGPAVTIGGVAVPAYGNPTNSDGTLAPPALGRKLEWVPLIVSMDENGVLNVYWKNQQIVTNLQTSWGPGPGRIVFGASTGSAMEYAAIDNLKIVTLPSGSDLPVVYVFQDATGFKYDELYNPFYPFSANLVVKLDGDSVTPTSLTNSGSIISLSYRLPAGEHFASGSQHELDFLFQDADGLSITEYKSFWAPFYTTVPAAYAVTGVDTTKPGFKVRPYQTAVAQSNSLAWTEEQLAGFHGANTANLTQILDGQPIDTSGYYTITNPVNWDGVELGRLDGNFQDNNGYVEVELPGAPPASPAGLASDYNNLSEEVVTFLHFPAAGVYTMGVNSDDGFKVTTGPNPKDTFSSQNLGQFDGGRGSSDTTFNFLITQPGDYPFRMIWENGGGGANCEWFTVNTDGTKVLINDPAGTNNTIKAYWSGPAPPQFNPTTISGSNVTISWTGTGTLQEATALTGSAGDWTDVSPQPSGSSYQITAGASGNKFYRLR